MDEKEELVKKDAVKADAGVPELADCMASVIADLEKDGKLPAVHTHTSALNSFTRFAGGEGTAMPVAEVFTPGRLKEYQQWLVQKGKSWNTVSTYIRAFQSTYYRLVEEGKIERIPKLFDDLYTKVEARTKRSLTEEQAETLLHADVSELPERVRCTLAYFLLMFLFRGMPFIDLCHLRKKDVKGNFIVYCRHKTGRPMAVRIPREAARLMEEFRDTDPDSVYLFPILNERDEKADGSRKSNGNGKSNGTDSVKRKGDAGGTALRLYNRYRKALRNFNKELAKLAALLLPGVKISSYTARHTWATLAFYQGIAIGIISKALGHSSVKVTETYLKPFEDEKVDRANDELIDAVAMCREKKKAA